VKRCEGMLERIDGKYEQCDNPAEHGSDSCWECQQLGNKTAAQLGNEMRIARHGLRNEMS
jgi:hypothetical protein